MAKCFCSNIMIMQLFHELKQLFPAIPDSVLSQLVEKNGYDLEQCKIDLEKVNSNYLIRSFPAGLVDKMTSDNHCKEFFSRQHYGRQSLDNSKIPEQKRQGWRMRKCDSTSKSAESLQGGDKNANVMPSIDQPDHLSNSIEVFDDLTDRLNSNCDKFVNKRSGSCGNINYGRTSVKVVSYPGPPPNSAPAILNQSCVPLSVDITTERPTRYIHKTALTMEPVPTYNEVHSRKSSRPFTSVNLILRQPSSEPSPIDIAMRGSSVTYSTFSSDSKHGYQSQLQIQFGPVRQSSISAASVKQQPVPIDPLNPSIHLVLQEQIKRKQHLEEALQEELQRLMKIEEEIRIMKQDLHIRQTTPNKLHQAKEDIIFLRSQCAKLTLEVDLAANEQVPLGETNEDFYKDTYRESELSLCMRNQGRTRNVDEPGWQCNMCTFINFHMLPKCEQCEMPRFDVKPQIPHTSNTHRPHQPRNALKSNVMS